MTGVLLLVLRAFLALLLYAFLGWVLYLLWKDLRQRQARLADASQAAEIRLEFEQSGSAFERVFQGPVIAIGRDPACECILTSETVSARHALFTCRNGQWWLEDLNSTNGTFLNHAPLTTPTVVASGDLLQFGDVKAVVVSAALASSPDTHE